MNEKHDPMLTRGSQPTLTFRRSMLASLGAILVVGLTYLPPVYQWIGGSGVLWIYDLAKVISALAAALLSLLLWRSFQRGEMLRKIWTYLSLGLILWALGEVLWSYDQLLSQDALPSTSIAGIAWLLGYIPFTLGLYVRFRTLRMTPKRGWRIGLLALVAVAGILATSYVMMPIVYKGEGLSPVSLMVNLLYPLGDLVLVFMTLLVTLVHIGGKLSRTWGWIALGFFTVAISDLAYAFAVWEKVYQVDPLTQPNILSISINLLYLAGYVCVDLGLYSRLRLQSVV